MKSQAMRLVLLAAALEAGLWSQQPAGTAQETPVAKQPTVKSQAEGQALMAMFQAQDPDSRIKAAQELIQKFADTEFKATALHFIAVSYQQKNDIDNMILYAEQTLEADPNHYMAMLMLANAIAQRTREFDLDREEKLARVEKYVRTAQELIQKAPRPNPQITEEQWQAAKRDLNSQALETLALAALARKNYDDAIAKFKASIETAANQDPATFVRLGATYNKVGKYDEAIAVLDKVMNDPQAHPQIRQVAQAERARAVQAKGAGAAAAPPAPAEPKPQP